MLKSKEIVSSFVASCISCSFLVVQLYICTLTINGIPASAFYVMPKINVVLYLPVKLSEKKNPSAS